MERTLYTNGTILTMEGGRTARSVLVEDGRIAALDQDAAALAGAAVVDLGGCTMLSAFLDAHSHLTAVANAQLQVSLEDCTDFQEIGRRIRDYIRQHRVPAGQWVVAQGYDHNELAEGVHPSLALLDGAAPENPLLVQHKSGHMGVVNSLGLRRLGITPETRAPEGGVIGVKDGRLTGYLEENAFIHYQKQLEGPDPEALLGAYAAAQKMYLSYGITTVQEGMLPRELVPLYQALCQKDLLTLDVVGYADAAQAGDITGALAPYIGQYRHNFRLGGYKIFLDGSPQGRTAWLRQPYLGDDTGYCGYPTMTDAQVEGAIRRAVADGMQLLAHCNGDAAAAQYLAAIEKLEGEGLDVAAIRPVLIHGQFLGRDQLDAVKRAGVVVSFFTAHTYHWGDVHIRNIGLPRAKTITPAASALDKGIPFTFHQDAPVLRPDMLETVWCAVVRRTKAGVQLEEAIGVADALRAVTINTAYQYFEEGSKGSIAPGKRADFAVLDRNPLAMAPEELREIQVVETIKAGKCLYRA